MSTELGDRTAIVTGAGGGIGRATAHALAELGAAVVVNDIGRDEAGTPTAEKVADEIRSAGGRAAANTDSVTDWDGAARMVELGLREFGSLDILVNNAGIAYSGESWDLDAKTFDRVAASHIQGTFYCSRHALGPMREQGWGRIVNLVSRAGITGMPGSLPYAAGKGGVFGITNALSRELDGSGITVNAVNPSSTRTPMVSGALENLSAMGDENRRRAENLRAAMQAPEQVAVVIATLCLPAAAAINGQIFLAKHNNVGLFQPLLITQQVERDGPWSPQDLCQALGGLDLHSLKDVYS